MQSDFLTQCKIEVKEPANCTDIEIDAFYEKVKKGGKVILNGLKGRIKNCELIAFCYYHKTLVGVSSIKRPDHDYVEDIISKTEIDRKAEELTFEIGYSFTEENFRRNGISGKLKSQLLENMKDKKGIIFSTTAIKSSQHFFEANGFQKKGSPYHGKNDKGITYYEKVLGIF